MARVEFHVGVVHESGLRTNRMYCSIADKFLHALQPSGADFVSLKLKQLLDPDEVTFLQGKDAEMIICRMERFSELGFCISDGDSHLHRRRYRFNFGDHLGVFWFPVHP